MEESFWVWTAALESEFLPLGELVHWADAEILRLDDPPKWLLDVSVATSITEALSALWQAWNRRVESTSSTDYSDRYYGQIYLGFLYVRFERGGLTMA